MISHTEFSLKLMFKVHGTARCSNQTCKIDKDEHNDQYHMKAWACDATVDGGNRTLEHVSPGRTSSDVESIQARPIMWWIASSGCMFVNSRSNSSDSSGQALSRAD